MQQPTNLSLKFAAGLGGGVMTIIVSADATTATANISPNSIFAAAKATLSLDQGSTIVSPKLNVTPPSQDVEADLDTRVRQVNALALRGERPKRDRNSWLKTVGQYPEEHPLNRIMDRGYELRRSECED